MANIYASNVISQKYDTALDFHVTMYDNMPYQRDSDYCNAEKLALVSGSVIKYYLCLNQPETFLVDNQDEGLEERLAILQQAEKKRRRREISADVPKDNTGITQEQIRTLLDDNENPSRQKTNNTSFDPDNTDAPPDAVNAFADVEDW
ncbi:MAG: hypothetical protein LUH14_05275 [Clostridiaceae bacterium]|nr:hypothetical protein [Clostridiaceae bacterium]